MNVYSRKPLEAKHRDFTNMGCPWSVMFTDEGPNLHYTDAEFAEHFYPAERLDTLLAAARYACNHPVVGGPRLREAMAAYDEALHALGEEDDEQDHEDQHEHTTTDIHAPTVGES